MTDIDVTRFVEAQRRDFGRALNEIEAGRKRSHWIWYVFPQIAGLGSSSMAQRYAITSPSEARAFLDHPELGANYRRIAAAVAEQVRRGVDLRRLLGSPDDAKVVSSLTLFAGVADGHDVLVSVAEEILAAAEAQGLPRCRATAAFLANG